MLEASRKITVLVASFAAFTMSFAAAPEEWRLTGSNQANYETGEDPKTSFRDRASTFLKSKSEGEGFASLIRRVDPVEYEGKRVRFSAWVKSEGVSQWAGLWMRVDGVKGAPPLAFDNMQKRPIKGTSVWKKYEVVLDVKEKATGVFFGILLGGPGQVWINAADFEVVSADVPTTVIETVVVPDPANLPVVK